jgi:peptidoglycan/LPS O-acetylase OafA/YrhL
MDTPPTQAAMDSLPAGSPALGYNPGLDGLRGVSVLAVMAYHSGFIRGGYLGVDVFFTLSGFLITMLLMEERAVTGAISFRKFYIRRALRLLPALAAWLLLCSLFTLLFAEANKAPYLWRAVLAVMFYVANWMIIAGQPLYVFNAAWSLSIEEHFYFLWPITLVGLLRLTKSRVVILALLLLVMGATPVWRAFLDASLASGNRIYLGSDTRLDSILIGCILGLLAAWRMLPHGPRAPTTMARVAAGAGLLGLLVIFATARYPPAFIYVASTLTALASALIIGGLLSGAREARWVLTRPGLVQTGRISYGLYLWHFPIFYLFGVLSLTGAAPEPLRAAAAWAATFAVSAVSFVILERPILRWKTRFKVV